MKPKTCKPPAISKRTRFEIFKRDLFQCAYCGRTPPAVVLEVDDINPRQLGGADEMANLITACFDCNRGKADLPLTSVPSPISEQAEIISEREEQIKAYKRLLFSVDRRKEKDAQKVSAIFSEYFDNYELSRNFIETTLKRHFLDSIPLPDILLAMRVACNRMRYNDNRAIRYFCGICWRKIGGDD